MSSLVADLKHTQEFLEGQRKLLAPDQFRVIVGKQSSTWCSRFRSSKISPSDCATVTGILVSGPWNEEQKGALGNALSESMMGTEGPAPRRPAQELKSFPRYITPNDAKVLRSDVHNMVKLSCVVDRCVNLSLHLPNTATVKHIVGCMVEGAYIYIIEHEWNLACMMESCGWCAIDQCFYNMRHW